MDYRALGELIWFALLGASVFAATTGIVLRFVLKPMVTDLIEAWRERGDTALPASQVVHRLERLEDRLVEMDTEVGDLRAEAEFGRRLQAGTEPED